MDKTFVSVVGDSGRHTRTLHKRARQNHFIGKAIRGLTKSVTNKVIDSKASKEQAADLKAKMASSPEFQKKLKEVNRVGTLAASTALILGAGAIAGPALGAGGAAKGAAGAAVPAIGSMAKKPVETISTVKDISGTGKAISDLGKLGGGNSPAAMPLGKPQGKSLSDINVKEEIDRLKQKAESSEVGKAIQNISEQLPPEVKKQIKDQARKLGKKVSESDIIANNRVSKELLPKTKVLKQTEEIASKMSDRKLGMTNLSRAGAFQLDGIEGYILGFVALLLVMAFIYKIMKG